MIESTGPKLGDRVWIHDANYGRTARKNWREFHIVDQNVESWILSNGLKVDKKTNLLRGADVSPMRRHVEYNLDAVEDDIYNDENRIHIVNAVQQADVVTLKAIDAVLTSLGAIKAA